ncbi:caspase-3-like [Mytilus californianus]|uniref:caspase-3-like n=1 Tax=Mytilus californianus TaxID=6549 RepID=UPI0022477E4B|nr:caspase-3-like [Mytilus californianus]
MDDSTTDKIDGKDEISQVHCKYKTDSSMDGLGKNIKIFFGISKSDRSRTYTATVIPAGGSEDYPQLSTITEAKTPKDSGRESDDRNEGKNDSSTRVVYKDIGKAMIASSSQTSDPLQALGEMGANLQQRPNLSVNLTTVISPDENNTKPGLALIITGQKFAKGNGLLRIGAETDLRNMFEIFYNLNFELRWEPFANRTTEGLKNELIKCADDPTLEQKKCLVIVISSHGGEVMLGRPNRPENIPHDINVYGHTISTYDGMIPTNEILEIFDVDSCPYMEGKPKLVFIQACRSRADKTVDKGVDIQVTQKQDIRQTRDFFNRSTMDVHHKEETNEDVTNIVYDRVTMKDMLLTPCYQDFMVTFASTAGHIAWSEDAGGALLTAMYNVFKKKIDNKQDIDLLPTMTEVCNKMMEYESSFSDQRYDRSKAVMCLLHMLGEEIILKPKY